MYLYLYIIYVYLVKNGKRPGGDRHNSTFCGGGMGREKHGTLALRIIPHSIRLTIARFVPFTTKESSGEHNCMGGPT